MLKLALVISTILANVVSSQTPGVSKEPVFSAEPACPVILPLPSLISQRVLGGQPVQHDDQLFHAWLRAPRISQSRFRFCSAIRLSKYWVLTSAHCSVTPEWNLILSSPSIREGGTRARIDKVYTHPKFTFIEADPFDFALLYIAPPPSELPEVHSVLLNNASWLPIEGAFIRVSGYGIMGYNTSDSTRAMRPIFDELHFVDVPIYPFSACKRAYGQLTFPVVPPLSTENHVCAGYDRNQCNHCKGDSGGPFLQYDKKGRAVQVAIIQASYGCAQQGYPGIGVRVVSVLPWFRQVGAVFDTAEAEQVTEENHVAPVVTARPSTPPSSQEEASAQGEVATPATSELPESIDVEDSNSDLSAGNGSKIPKRGLVITSIVVLAIFVVLIGAVLSFKKWVRNR